MDSFNPTRPNPYAYWNVGRLHANDSASPSPLSESISSQQRQTYQLLELLPCSDQPGPTFSFGLGSAWRKLLQLLVDELIEEQQVSYLERCWAANDPMKPSNPPLKQFLTLIQ